MYRRTRSFSLLLVLLLLLTFIPGDHHHHHHHHHLPPDMRVMQLGHGRNNQLLNLGVGILARQLVGAQGPALGVPPSGGHGRGRRRHAQPGVGAAGADKDHLPLARGQQVADDEVVLVAVERVARLADEDGRVRLELVRDDHALGRPAVDEVLEELGHGVEVDDEALGAGDARRGVKVVKLLVHVGGDNDSVGGLDLVLGHALRRHEKVRHGGGQVQQAPGPQGPHEARQGAQLVQVVADGDEGDHEQHVGVAGAAVLGQHVAHLGGVVAGAPLDLARRPGAQEVEEAVLGVGEVARVGEQAELAVQEDDGVAGLEEVLGRGGPAGARREVVDEADRLLLEGHRRAARRDEHHAAGGEGVRVDEGGGEARVFLEGARRRVGGEVDVLVGGRGGRRRRRGHCGGRGWGRR